MIRVVIMCQGQQTRLRDLQIPKQLLPLPLCNTTILDRTIKLLTADDRIGEIVVIGGPEISRHLVGRGAPIMPSHFHLVGWTMACGGDFAACDAQIVTLQHKPGTRAAIEVVSLDLPGNSVIRGLQRLTCYLKQEACVIVAAGGDRELEFERTVILLGDVVYSRRCLALLVNKVAPPKIWFAVSPDLSPSGGEVYGLSYDVDGTAEFLTLLREVAHPPFTDTYQPGQLRRLLWKVQQDGLEAEMLAKGTPPAVAAIVRANAPAPLEGFCSILHNDYTRDFDTIEDLAHLGAVDVAAWKDGIERVDPRTERCPHGRISAGHCATCTGNEDHHP